MKKLPIGEELYRLCTMYQIVQTPDLERNRQQRLLDFLEHRRGQRLWILALVSGIASVVAAAAAILAVLFG